MQLNDQTLPIQSTLSPELREKMSHEMLFHDVWRVIIGKAVGALIITVIFFESTGQVSEGNLWDNSFKRYPFIIILIIMCGIHYYNKHAELKKLDDQMLQFEYNKFANEVFARKFIKRLTNELLWKTAMFMVLPIVNTKNRQN